MKNIIFGILVLLPIAVFSQSREKEIFAGDFVAINVTKFISEDNFQADSMIFFLDTNVIKYTPDTLLQSFIKNPITFNSMICKYPKIYFDFNSFVNFYYNRSNAKYQIDYKFINKSKSLWKYEHMSFSKQISIFDSELGFNVLYLISLDFFEAKASFVKHNIYPNVSGCKSLSISKNGYLYFSGEEKERIGYFPVVN